MSQIRLAQSNSATGGTPRKDLLVFTVVSVDIIANVVRNVLPTEAEDGT